MADRRLARGVRAGLAGAILVLAAGIGNAQSCTSQAKLSVDARGGLSEAGLTFADAVKASNIAKLQASAITEYASNFTDATTLITNTSERLTGDSLAMAQIYMLDARNRKAGDTGDADFSCSLQGTGSETDFSISGLPPGLYGFLMVEATGEHPYLLSFLVRQETGKWKLAGFYPHPRQAAGHDGLWFWSAARENAKAKQTWASWVLYGQADELLRPANFVTSTNLDKLRAEQRAVAPPGLAEGISETTPLVLPGASGTEFRFTGVSSAGSDDGKRLNLVLRLQADAGAAGSAAEMARNTAAASAMLAAHKDLRQGFDGVTVIANVAGQPPFVTQQLISEIH